MSDCVEPQEQQPVSRQEACWAVAVGAITLSLAQLPYVLAYLFAPPTFVFSGALMNLQDANSYLSKIRQGATSGWLFQNLYTAEPHQSGPLYLFYIGLGKAASVFDLTPDMTLTLARPVFGILLLAALYWFLSVALPHREQRQAGFLLLCISSGLGWLLAIVAESAVLGDPSPDLWVPEAITFLTLLSFPHFAMATALMLAFFGGLLSAFRTGRYAPAFGAAIACFALSWVHPFNLVIMFGVMTAYLGWQVIRQHRVLWRQTAQLLLCFIVSFPVVLYLQLVVIARNPVFRAWVAQGEMLSPNPLAYLLGYGLLVPLTVLGIVHRSEAAGPSRRLLVLWLAVGSVLLYLPVDTQRRFLEGMHIPFALLAALGCTATTLAKSFPKAVAIVLKAALIASLVASNVVILANTVTIAMGQHYPFFIHDFEVEAFAWLDAHSQARDTVLSSPLVGSFIPAWSGNRVVIGHWAETTHLEEKMNVVLRFFAADTPPQIRRAILEQYGVRYLFHGPNERELGGYDPAGDLLWELTFRNDQVSLYRSTLTY